VVLVVALFSAKALESVSQRQWYFGSRRVGLQVRSALMAFIYRKDLRLANAGTSRTFLFGSVWNWIPRFRRLRQVYRLRPLDRDYGMDTRSHRLSGF